MSRDRTGTIEPFKRADGSTYYRAKVRLGDGTRERVDVPEKHAATDERRRLYAAAVQEREDERGELLAKKRAREAAKAAQHDPRAGETCTTYRERLDKHRKELGRGGQRHDLNTWNRWIAKRLGALPIEKVTRDDVEKFRDMLDEQIATHTRTGGAEGIGAKTALNVWSVVTTTFKAAVQSKRRDLRVRTDNPCTGVLPPERGESRRRTFVHPSEMAAVLDCLDVALEWREAYAIASYLYLRPGELCALTWADIDSAGAVAHVTKALDETTGEVKPPKTSNGIRDVPIPPTLLPLLKRMGDGRPSTDLVVPIVAGTPASKRAPRFLRSLRAAGVDRPRLYENTPTTMGVNFRSCRDSGITWLALSGVDLARMQRRAGHDSVSSTLAYVKQAEDTTGLAGAPFGPLPSTLVEGVMGAGDVLPKSMGRRPRYQSKYQSKLPVEFSTHRQNVGERVEARGVEPLSESA